MSLQVPTLDSQADLAATTLRSPINLDLLPEDFELALSSLLSYCRAQRWSGHDPYDGLNSRLFQASPFSAYRWPRLALTQFLKRCPVNLRSVLQVPKEPNPKGLALFTSALTRLTRLGRANIGEVREMTDALLAARSPGQTRSCWGYNFDWQTRTYLVPRGTPNIICTTFAGNALLDAHELLGDDSLIAAAVSAGHYLLEGLNRTEDASSFCFSYTPLDKSQIHNANLLGGAFLARLLPHAGPAFEPAIRASTEFSTARQRPDGSWPYGEGPKQQWIDSFHTGYNLVALKRIRESLSDSKLDRPIQSGFEFFLKHFFTSDARAKYFHDRIYPIDSHSVAQAILTLITFQHLHPDNLKLASEVCEWSLRNMRDPSGFFYFQQHALYTNKIAYMRWVQGWMLVALSALAESASDPKS